MSFGLQIWDASGQPAFTVDESLIRLFATNIGTFTCTQSYRSGGYYGAPSVPLLVTKAITIPGLSALTNVTHLIDITVKLSACRSADNIDGFRRDWAVNETYTNYFAYTHTTSGDVLSLSYHAYASNYDPIYTHFRHYNLYVGNGVALIDYGTFTLTYNIKTYRY